MPPSPDFPNDPQEFARAPRPRRAIPHPAARAAVVAASTAAAALAVLLPGAPAPAPATTAPAAVAAPVAPVAFAAPTRAPAAAALDNAMSKVGAPYRYGAAGPHAFDCSGLVSWAFKEAGVALPRTSRAMSKVGSPVDRDDLRPGDVVFFYRPVSHVAIYIGGGKVVHASTRKSPVKISKLADMPFTSARRV